jgi:selenocysteine lyase/cysteine desulfurase
MTQVSIPFDVTFARSQFPFFETDSGKDWALFDNAGGTLPCRQVVDRLHRFYVQNKVQPYGHSAVGVSAGQQMDDGRQTIADLLGIPLETLTFGPSTTQNVNTLSFACAGLLNPGDDIIVSEQDHEANIGGWERIARQTGADFRLWPVDSDTGELHLEDLERLLSSRTKIVCVTQSSNILGTLNPIDEIIQVSHHVGARVIIDGVSFAPHRWPDLSTSLADAYLFSTYKTFGTHMGILYVASDFLDDLTPQCHFFNESHPGSRLDAAGPDHAAIAALAGLGAFLRTLHHHHFGESDASLNALASHMSALTHRHETKLCSVLLKALESIPCRVIGRIGTEDREANIALLPHEKTAESVSVALAEHHIAAGQGHFYAHRLLSKLGVPLDDGVLRLSFALYNTEGETRRLISALEQSF